eukprot:1478241-Pleurochrysis_carterae.AAC.1
MVALVAVDAAFASVERMRSKSLPLPLHASEYERRAAEQRLASSAESGGNPEPETEVAAAGAAVGAAAGAAVCERGSGATASQTSGQRVNGIGSAEHVPCQMRQHSLGT